MRKSPSSGVTTVIYELRSGPQYQYELNDSLDYFLYLLHKLKTITIVWGCSYRVGLLEFFDSLDDMRFTLARKKSSELKSFSCYVPATTANYSTTRAREYGR